MASIKDVKAIVGRTQDENGNPRDETLSEFSKQWRSLDDKDKADLKKGVDDGSMTY
jgi:hypothetical protein